MPCTPVYHGVYLHPITYKSWKLYDQGSNNVIIKLDVLNYFNIKTFSSHDCMMVVVSYHTVIGYF